jgi:flagellar biosynthesis protein FlhG
LVTGGRKGVGTTTIAANLTAALVRRGLRAVLIDADFDHRHDVHPPQSIEPGIPIEIPHSIQILSLSRPKGKGAQHAAADSEQSEEQFIDELQTLAPRADVVVIDAGSGRGPLVHRAWQAAGVALVVTTADPASVMQCYATITALAASEARPALRTLVNFAHDARSAAGVHARVAEACRRFLGMPAIAAGHVARCPTVAGAAGFLIYPPRSEPAKAVDHVADVVWAQLQLQTRHDAPDHRAALRSA